MISKEFIVFLYFSGEPFMVKVGQEMHVETENPVLL